MNTLKRFASVLTVIVLAVICIVAFPTEAQAETYGDLTYTVSNGEVTITDCKTAVEGILTIPSLIDGYPVTAIGNSAFSWCDEVTAVSIPNSIKSIGSSAFYQCDAITAISIPNSVTFIGAKAFNHCNVLATVTIGTGVTSLEEYTFGSCSSLTSITIPGNIKTIGRWAFSGCSKLSTVKIKEGVVTIGEKSFYAAPISTLRLPGTVTTIEAGAFAMCEELSAVTYCGTESEWNNVEIIGWNDELRNAAVTYHNWKAASCAGPKTCTICGDTVGSAVHSWKSATCTAPKTCSLCRATTGSALGHNWKAASCTAPKTCTRCGTTESEPVHSWTAATCTAPKTCSLCGTTDGETLAHDLTEANCTTPKTCTVCGATEGEPLGHSGETWFVILEPTCTEDGIKARICDVCGDTESVQLPLLGHQWETADCSKPMTCSRCQTTQGEPAHNWSDATCTEPQTCTLCGATQGDAAGHSWSAWIQTKAPSCTEEGSQTRFCNCGEKETQAIEKAHTCENGICTACGALGSYYWVLAADANVTLTLEQDLYVDLNGFDLSGTIATNGYKVYGMDSTTNLYTCDQTGYFTCVDENGDAIIPQRHFKTTAEMTGDIRRYMAIETDSGYSFHRFYLGITNTSLKPDTVSVGYKTVFYGDSMVAAQLDSFGYTMQLGSFNAVSRSKSADSFVSGKTVTLRINNCDAENYGETALYASVFLQLSDGTTIQSAEYAVTLKDMVESINTNYTAYNADQLTALQTMIANNPAMQSWTVDNLYTKET